MLRLAGRRPAGHHSRLPRNLLNQETEMTVDKFNFVSRASEEPGLPQFLSKFNTMTEAWNSCNNPKWILFMEKYCGEPHEKALERFCLFCIPFLYTGDTWVVTKDAVAVLRHDSGYMLDAVTKMMGFDAVRRLVTHSPKSTVQEISKVFEETQNKFLLFATKKLKTLITNPFL